MTGQNIKQINLQHCRAAAATLCRHLGSTPDIALIQEPWVVNSRISGMGSLKGTTFVDPKQNKPRTCIYVPGYIQALLLPHLSGRDITVVQISCDVGEKIDIILVSAYLPGDSTDLPPSRELMEVVNYCERNQKHLIIGCDSNAHHLIWGSADINPRGRALLEYLSSTNLEILNRGCEPTFVTSRCQTVIDITLASSSISRNIVNWQVSPLATLSDHRMILFKLKDAEAARKEYRNPRSTDRLLYAEHLLDRLRLLPASNKVLTIEDLQKESDLLQTSIVDSFQQACPMRTASTRSATLWWCKELEKLKSTLGKLFNKAKKSKTIVDWEAYKHHQRLYKNEIRKRQRDSWRSFCNAVETTKDSARLNKILSKDPQQQPASLKREDGTYTTNVKETAEVLMRTHFPGCNTNPLPHTWIDDPNSTPGEEEWEIANLVVEEEKVIWAIKTFHPFKSPGLDGIFPALLQWSLDLLMPHLLRIFRGCIAFRYTPKSWREVKVVFIPKPGRRDYSLAKSYRPISLTSFLLKTLERLCDRYIRDHVLATKPLHPNQHAYIPGRSTESALHTVAGRIERSLDNKMSTLGVFIDIEGAFDKTTFDSINTALRERGVNDTLREWIIHFLKHRAVHITVGNTTIRGTVSRGCPQGGVLSPLLWNLVVDSLIHRLNVAGFYTVGYADDISILLNGKFEQVLCNLMQTALRSTEQWCTEHSLSINPTKTEMVLFTRKRKVEVRRAPTLFQTPLTFSDEVKYLGVIFDKKLNWGKHIRMKIEKANVAFWQCRRAMGRLWGPSPKAVLWLYTAIIRPMLCYGAVIWWPRARLVTTATELSHIQRLVCISITGAIRSTPTAALEVTLGLPPLDCYVEEVALRTAIRLQVKGLWNEKGSGGKHQHILKEAVHKTPLLGAAVDSLPPTFVFKRHFRVFLNSENASKPDISIFTDGSKTNEGTGAGIFSEDLNLNQSLPLGMLTTVFQAETLAIMQGASAILEHGIQNKTVRIASDSRAALLALNNCKVVSGVILQCYRTLQLAARNNVLQLVWVKGHAGLYGNEQADALARQGSEEPFWGPEPAVAPSLTLLYTIIAQETHNRHCDRWVNMDTCHHARMAIATPSRRMAKFCAGLSRKKLRLLVGILSGHCRLNKHMYRMGLVADPTCRGCNLEDETAEHILCECPALAQIRGSMLGDFWPDMASIRSTPLASILKFIERVGWLE